MLRSQVFENFKIPINVKNGELDRVMDGRPEMTSAQFFEMVCRDQVLPLRRVVARMRVYFDLFQLFDRDQSGKISHVEIGKTITDLFGWRPTKYECEKIIAIGEGFLGGEKEGQIEFREFAAMLTLVEGKGALYDQLRRMKSQLYYLHSVFLSFDVDSDHDVVFNITWVEFSKVRVVS